MSGQDHAHGSFKTYTILIVILAVVTFIEWQALPGKMFYFEALHPYLKPILIGMSVFKFFAVVFYYMHLKFDAPIFRRLFLGVLALAFVCVSVVMAVLKALPGGSPDMARIELIRPLPPEMAAARAAKKVERSGEELYNTICVACHQANGSGEIAGTRLGANLTEASLWAKGDDVLMNSIVNGVVGDIGAMPAQKGALSEGELKAVFEHIKKTFKK